jgi:hypothetical protein
MADAYRINIADTKMTEVPFEDRFNMIVDIEYQSRKNNRLKRLIKSAGFDHDLSKEVNSSSTLSEIRNGDHISFKGSRTQLLTY